MRAALVKPPNSLAAVWLPGKVGSSKLATLGKLPVLFGALTSQQEVRGYDPHSNYFYPHLFGNLASSVKRLETLLDRRQRRSSIWSKQSEERLFFFSVSQFVLYLNNGVQLCVGLPSLLQEKITCRLVLARNQNSQKLKRRRNHQKKNTKQSLIARVEDDNAKPSLYFLGQVSKCFPYSEQHHSLLSGCKKASARHLFMKIKAALQWLRVTLLTLSVRSSSTNKMKVRRPERTIWLWLMTRQKRYVVIGTCVLLRWSSDKKALNRTPMIRLCTNLKHCTRAHPQHLLRVSSDFFLLFQDWEIVLTQ